MTLFKLLTYFTRAPDSNSAYWEYGINEGYSATFNGHEVSIIEVDKAYEYLCVGNDGFSKDIRYDQVEDIELYKLTRVE